MGTHSELYSWQSNGQKVIITYQVWRSFLGMVTASCLVSYEGKRLEDGSIFWLRDDGQIVSESMEKKLNRIDFQYQKKTNLIR